MNGHEKKPLRIGQGYDSLNRTTFFELYKSDPEKPFAMVTYKVKRKEKKDDVKGNPPVTRMIGVDGDLLFEIIDGKLAKGDPDKYRNLMSFVDGSEISKKYPHVGKQLSSALG